MGKLRGSLLGAFFLLGLLLASFHFILPAATGKEASVMISSSMAPEFPRGSLAISEPASYTDFKVGEVVKFQTTAENTPKAHRVVEINPDGTLVTKGDALPSADAFAIGPETYSVSKVVYTSFWLGWAITLAPWVMGILVILYIFSFARGGLGMITALSLVGALCVWLMCMFTVSPISNIELIDINKERANPRVSLVNTGLVGIVVTPISDGVEGEGVKVPPKQVATVAAEPDSELVDFALRPDFSLPLVLFSTVPYLLWLPFYVAMASVWARRAEESVGPDLETSPADDGIWDEAGYFRPGSPRVSEPGPAQSLR